ncbi:MAG: DUF4129 domain-containing protein [Acidobacteria bacterium]|nr:DUF4129 domain-containing protein [Acidobacteriota bacterium]
MKRRLACILLLIASTAAVWGETPLAEYAARLDRAAEILAALFEQEDEDEDPPNEEEILGALEEIESIIPATAEIRFEDRVLRVDNSKLIEAVRQLAQRYTEETGSEEERYDQLVEISARIAALAERVGAGVEAGAVQENEDARAQLSAILARPEYSIEAPVESRLQKWMREMWEAFLKILLRVFSADAEPRPQPGTGTLAVVRVLITAALAAALAVGAYTLVRRLRGARRSKRREEKREVLGETLPEDTTAASLYRTAAELAQRGEWRAALRRAYIALLYELDERGKLRLERAKTNRDYLNDLRTDAEVYPRVAVRTEIFERVWYGEHPASRADYERFVERSSAE